MGQPSLVSSNHQLLMDTHCRDKGTSSQLTPFYSYDAYQQLNWGDSHSIDFIDQQ